MPKLTATLVVPLAIALGGCGVGQRTLMGHRTKQHTSVRKPVARAAAKTAAPKPDVPLRALVTAQTENRLLVVRLPGGRVVRELAVPGDPSYVDAGGVIVVVGSVAGTVTLLDPYSMRVIKVFRGFVSPHIPAISPDWQYAYVTDDGSGELAAIGLYNDKLLSRVFVGAGAHHLAFSPDQSQVWVALGQSANTLTLLSTVDPGHPRVVGHLHPPFLAHDLLFAPDGKEVWITSSDTSYVGVFSVRTHRLLFKVPAGAPPQHLAFASGDAYITSGYGSSIEQVALRTGRVLRRTFAPYGSFDLDAGRGYVVTASLLRGTLAVYNQALRLLKVRQLAPSTEDVALLAP